RPPAGGDEPGGDLPPPHHHRRGHLGGGGARSASSRGGDAGGGALMTSLRNIGALVEKEWRHYFGSPIAYVAICIWALLFGGFYLLVMNRFIVYSLRAGMSEMG